MRWMHTLQMWRTFARRWINIGIEEFSQKGAASVLALLAVRARYEDPRAPLRGLAHSYGAFRIQIRPDKVAPIMGTHQTGGTRAHPHQFARFTLTRRDERMTLISVSKCCPSRIKRVFKDLIHSVFFLFYRDIRVKLWGLQTPVLIAN